MRVLTDRVEIAATGRALPARVVANAEIVEGLETSDDWVRENIGVLEGQAAELPDATDPLSRIAAGPSRPTCNSSSWRARHRLGDQLARPEASTSNLGRLEKARTTAVKTEQST